MRLEGSGCSKMVELIRAVGKNVEVTFELATVIKSPPDLKIKIDNMDVELTKEDLIVSEYLMSHKRNVDITGQDVNIPMSTQGYYPHTHETFSINIQGAEITFNDELKTGDRIIVAGVNAGQMYIVLGRPDGLVGTGEPGEPGESPGEGMKIHGNEYHNPTFATESGLQEVVDALNGKADDPHGDAAHTESYEKTGNKGVANGYCPLDLNSKVPVQNLPEETTEVTNHGDEKHTESYEKTGNKGVANGYCPLDGEAKVPEVHLPDTGVELPSDPKFNTVMVHEGDEPAQQATGVFQNTINTINGDNITINTNMLADFRFGSTTTNAGNGIKFTHGNTSSYTGSAAIAFERTGSWGQGKLHVAVNDEGISEKTSLPIKMTIDGPNNETVFKTKLKAISANGRVRNVFAGTGDPDPAIMSEGDVYLKHD